jgi:hypothetical protein
MQGFEEISEVPEVFDSITLWFDEVKNFVTADPSIPVDPITSIDAIKQGYQRFVQEIRMLNFANVVAKSHRNRCHRGV